MSKQRLFPERPEPRDDGRNPKERFSDLASKLFTVPKSEIDEREREWKHKRRKSKR